MHVLVPFPCDRRIGKFRSFISYFTFIYSVSTAMIMKSVVDKKRKDAGIHILRILMNLHNANFASFLIFYFLKNISRALGAEKRDSLYFTAGTNRLTRPDEYELEVLVPGVKTESEKLASDLLPVHVVQEHLPLIQGPDGGIQ